MSSQFHVNYQCVRYLYDAQEMYLKLEKYIRMSHCANHMLAGVGSLVRVNRGTSH